MKLTQKEIILNHIEEYGYITSADAFGIYGITQLATRIKELKAKGYVFDKERVNTTNRFGRATHYDKYMLVREEVV